MTYYIKNATHAAAYSKFRPVPPQNLISKIIDFIREEITEPLNTSVDIGCGTGQSTTILSPYFKNVIGIDNNHSQIQAAQEQNNFQNVSYRVGSAEEFSLDNDSVQLVTACQCVHWFNLDRFYKEVRRVLQPGGVLAIYGYNFPQAKKNNISLSAVFENMFKITMNKYMLEESKLVYFKSYNAPEYFQFPFSSQPTLRLKFNAKVDDSTISDLVGYVTTGSTFQNYLKQEGEKNAVEILHEFEVKLMKTIGANGRPEETYVDTIFPYFLLLGRKSI